MALLTSTGRIDLATNIVVPTDTNSWANLTPALSSTWDDLSFWITRPVDPMIWVSDTIDLGKSIAFTLQVATEVNGVVSYIVYASDDLTFPDGATTTTTINSGDENIPAFEGRYCRVAASVANSGGIQQLTSMTMTTGNQRLDILLNDIDSSSLEGDSTSRQLDLGRAVSYVLNLQITPYVRAGGSSSYYITSGYWAADYVIEEANTAGVFPQIIDKTGGNANVAFIDNTGNFVDSVFDAVAYVMPEQYMDGNNLAVR
jgi:hypothetical protein